MLLKEYIAGSVQGLASVYGPEEARSVVLMLCEAYLGTRNYTHIVNPDFVIGEDSLEKLDSAMERLKTGEPIQYVLGYADFAGFRFMVDSSVLIPRPETEQLYRAASDSIGRRRRMRSAFGTTAVKVLDLCTGSGCLAWSLALSSPGTQVLAVDISPEALATAEGQDFKAELKKTGAVRPVFLRSDILDTGDGTPLSGAVAEWGQFDILVSNPPYVRDSERAVMRKNVLEFEPGLALFVPDSDPLKFYRAIAVWAGRSLSDGGACFVEINEAFGPETRKLFSGSGFSNVEVLTDFCGKNRFVKFIK